MPGGSGWPSKTLVTTATKDIGGLLKTSCACTAVGLLGPTPHPQTESLDQTRGTDFTRHIRSGLMDKLSGSLASLQPPMPSPCQAAKGPPAPLTGRLGASADFPPRATPLPRWSNAGPNGIQPRALDPAPCADLAPFGLWPRGAATLPRNHQPTLLGGGVHMVGVLPFEWSPRCDRCLPRSQWLPPPGKVVSTAQDGLVPLKGTPAAGRHGRQRKGHDSWDAHILLIESQMQEEHKVHRVQACPAVGCMPQHGVGGDWGGGVRLHGREHPSMAWDQAWLSRPCCTWHYWGVGLTRDAHSHEAVASKLVHQPPHSKNKAQKGVGAPGDCQVPAHVLD